MEKETQYPHCLFKKGSTLIDLEIEKKIKLRKNKRIIEVSGNMEAFKVHNFLLKKKNFFFQVFHHILWLLLVHV